MRVERIFDPEAREEFDEWLFEPVTAQKKRTPQEEFELAMARYELGIGPEPTPFTMVEEGAVIEIGRAR